MYVCGSTQEQHRQENTLGVGLTVPSAEPSSVGVGRCGQGWQPVTYSHTRAEDLPNAQYSTLIKTKPRVSNNSTYSSQTHKCTGISIKGSFQEPERQVCSARQACFLPHVSSAASSFKKHVKTPPSRKSSLNSPVKLPTSQIYG